MLHLLHYSHFAGLGLGRAGPGPRPGGPRGVLGLDVGGPPPLERLFSATPFQEERCAIWSITSSYIADAS